MNASVFTDGACSRNGSKRAVGGTGVFFGEGHPESKGEPPRPGMKVTNQTMELLAIVRALEALLRMRAQSGVGGSATVHSDSLYSIKCLTVWIHAWRRNGWQTAFRGKVKDVKNKDIISEASALMEQCERAGLQVAFKHVRAHMQPPADATGQGYAEWFGNARADALARRAVEALRPEDGPPPGGIQKRVRARAPASKGRRRAA